MYFITSQSLISGHVLTTGNGIKIRQAFILPQGLNKSTFLLLDYMYNTCFET